jgi:hypothetical protein
MWEIISHAPCSHGASVSAIMSMISPPGGPEQVWFWSVASCTHRPWTATSTSPQKMCLATESDHEWRGRMMGIKSSYHLDICCTCSPLHTRRPLLGLGHAPDHHSNCVPSIGHPLALPWKINSHSLHRSILPQPSWNFTEHLAGVKNQICTIKDEKLY